VRWSRSARCWKARLWWNDPNGNDSSVWGAQAPRGNALRREKFTMASAPLVRAGLAFEREAPALPGLARDHDSPGSTPVSGVGFGVSPNRSCLTSLRKRGAWKARPLLHPRYGAHARDGRAPRSCCCNATSEYDNPRDVAPIRDPTTTARDNTAECRWRYPSHPPFRYNRE
jgi:hypothetical protein